MPTFKLVFAPEAQEDYEYFKRYDIKIARKINALIKNTMNAPFSGIGKPEPLKHELAGFWSRRIDKAHRLVYCVMGDELHVVSCRYNYK
ncbi:MAG: Txe/YoeB family addiction module toxin [Synergistaceae bacterium]|nr:Txe/YoeB family addiction module toxin [Synergistaceae bacterium]